MLTHELSSLINPVCPADKFTASGNALNQDCIGGVTGIATVEIDVSLAILIDFHTGVPVKQSAQIAPRLDTAIPLIVAWCVKFNRLLRTHRMSNLDILTGLLPHFARTRFPGEVE